MQAAETINLEFIAWLIYCRDKKALWTAEISYQTDMVIITNVYTLFLAKGVFV